MKIIVTGGSGFIGSYLVKYLVGNSHTVINFDKLTYASNLKALVELENNKNYSLIKSDICNQNSLKSVFDSFKPDAVMHLAAESHVDRSIDNASPFIQTNIVGTFNLLEISRKYWKNNKNFKFHHISTDEVYGSLGSTGFFTEETSYSPNSPYSASKAASDHLVRAWYHTYGLPVLVTNCSNNYGPFQFFEKLIPLTILNALELKELPVYGRGENIRDWLYVEDHVKALSIVLEKGKIGETYNIGGRAERKNIDVVKSICFILDEIFPKSDGTSYSNQIRFVQDRPGHDQRYSIDCQKIERELGWTAQESFESGLRKTVLWYLEYFKKKDKKECSDDSRKRLGLKI